MTAHAHRRPWLVVAVAAALFAALALVACGGGSDDDRAASTTTTTTAKSTSSTSSSTTSSSTTAASSTTASTAPTTTTAKPAPATSSLALYFVQGDHLAVARRTLTVGSTPATAAMKALLAGPTAAEKAAGLSTAVPGASALRGITIRDGRAFVDLTTAFESGGGTLSMTLRLAQVVFTMTQFPTVDSVVLMLNGAAVSVFSGEGLILDKYQRRGDFEELGVVPAVLVESPGWGAAVSSPVRARGSANVFEAVFRLELTDWDGRIVASQIVHAASGTGTRGTFDAALRYTTNRTGPGSLIVSYDSPKDGSRVVLEEIPLTVRR